MEHGWTKGTWIGVAAVVLSASLSAGVSLAENDARGPSATAAASVSVLTCEQPVAAAAPANDAAAGCPGDAPRCIRDRECDAYCGTPGFGECEWPAFCCACLG